MDNFHFAKILIISSAFIISGANASTEKLDIDETIIKDEKITNCQIAHDFGINKTEIKKDGIGKTFICSAGKKTNLNKPTMNSDTKQPRKKFGHRVKKLGKNIKENVEKVTKSPKAREIRNKVKDVIRKEVEKVKR